MLQSHFLQAIGLAIASSIWQMCLIWLAYLSVVKLGKLPAAQKYVLAAVGSLLGMVAFVGSVVYYCYYATPVQIISWQQWNQLSNEQWFLPQVFVILRSFIPYISMAYLCTAIVLAIRLYKGFATMAWWQKPSQLQKAPVQWRLFVQEFSAILHIKQPVQVWLSQKVNSPLTIGFFKPVILLPLASINQLTTQQMEAVLLHELSHIRRNDFLINIFLQIAGILLFFNPFMHHLLQQAFAEREHSCDDWVLQFNYDAGQYASALLLLEQQSTRHALALCAAQQQPFHFLHRIRRMVLRTEHHRIQYRSKLGLLSFMMILAFLIQVVVNNTIQNQNAGQAWYKSNTPANKHQKMPDAEKSPMPTAVSIALFDPSKGPNSSPKSTIAAEAVAQQAFAKTKKMEMEEREMEFSDFTLSHQALSSNNIIANANHKILTATASAVAGYPIQPPATSAASPQWKVTAPAVIAILAREALELQMEKIALQQVLLQAKQPAQNEVVFIETPRTAPCNSCNTEIGTSQTYDSLHPHYNRPILNEATAPMVAEYPMHEREAREAIAANEKNLQLLEESLQALLKSIDKTNAAEVKKLWSTREFQALRKNYLNKNLRKRIIIQL